MKFCPPSDNGGTLDYSLIESISERHLDDLAALYENEWWCRGRSRDDIRRMLDGTEVVLGLVDRDDRLVGFTRVLSDGVYKALIFDVIVAPECRDRKLGRVLMDAVVNHPKLKNVQHLELYCLPELEPFYERWGFTSELGRLRFMRRC